MDWIEMTREKPVHFAWQLKGFATLHVPGYPNTVKLGTFITRGECSRLKKELNWAPYAVSWRYTKYGPAEEILFIDEDGLFYAEDCIVAWMPLPEPFGKEDKLSYSSLKILLGNAISLLEREYEQQGYDSADSLHDTLIRDLALRGEDEYLEIMGVPYSW